MAVVILTDEDKKEYKKLQTIIFGFLDLLNNQDSQHNTNKYLMLLWKKIDDSHELFNKLLNSDDIDISKQSLCRLINKIKIKMAAHIRYNYQLTKEQKIKLNEYYRRINLININ